MKYKLFSILMLLYLCNLNYSQSLYDNFQNQNNDLEKFDQNKNVFESTNSNEWVYMITVPIGLTGLSMLFDDEISIDVKKENSDLMEIAHYYGNFYYSLPIAGVLYFSEVIFGSNQFSKIGKELVRSLLVGAMASISLKYAFGRSRPYRDKGNMDFNWFESENRFNSLPSGDVITAFTASTVLSNYFNNTYVSVLLYGVAGLTAYQRIASDNHWFSDTVLSASIGIIVGNYFGDFDEKNSQKSISYNVFPFAASNYAGINLNITF